MATSCIYTLHTDFIGNSVKLRNPHNFYLRVPENRVVTAIWKKPMRIFSRRVQLQSHALSGGSILGIRGTLRILWRLHWDSACQISLGSTSHEISDCSGGLSKRWFGGTAGGIENW